MPGRPVLPGKPGARKQCRASSTAGLKMGENLTQLENISRIAQFEPAGQFMPEAHRRFLRLRTDARQPERLLQQLVFFIFLAGHADRATFVEAYLKPKRRNPTKANPSLKASLALRGRWRHSLSTCACRLNPREPPLTKTSSSDDRSVYNKPERMQRIFFRGLRGIQIFVQRGTKFAY